VPAGPAGAAPSLFSIAEVIVIQHLKTTNYKLKSLNLLVLNGFTYL